MENFDLFLGFPLTVEFSEKLSKLQPEIRELFIQDSPTYLNRVVQNGVVYLGKGVGKVVDIDTLSLYQNHILSMLKRLVPNYSYQQDFLILFPIYN